MMDELDDLAAFGLAEIDEDRAAGEWADPHAPECDCSMRVRLVGDGCAVCNPDKWAHLAPEVGAVLTTAQAVDLARYWLDDTAPPEWWPVDTPVTFRASKAMSEWVLAVAPVVAAAEAQADAVEAWKDANAKFSRLSVGQGHRPVDEARWATESAVRAYRAAGGGA